MIVWRRCCTDTGTGTGRPGCSYCAFPNPFPWLDVVCNKSLGLVRAQLQLDSGLVVSVLEGNKAGGRRGKVEQSLLQCLAAAKYLHFHFWFIIVIAMCKLPKRRCKQAAGNHYKGTLLSMHLCMSVCMGVCVCAALTRTHYVGQMNGNCGTETSNWSATRWATQIDSLLWLTSVWPLVPPPLPNSVVPLSRV